MCGESSAGGIFAPRSHHARTTAQSFGARFRAREYSPANAKRLFTSSSSCFKCSFATDIADRLAQAARLLRVVPDDEQTVAKIFHEVGEHLAALRAQINQTQTHAG